MIADAHILFRVEKIESFLNLSLLLFSQLRSLLLLLRDCFGRCILPSHIFKLNMLDVELTFSKIAPGQQSTTLFAWFPTLFLRILFHQLHILVFVCLLGFLWWFPFISVLFRLYLYWLIEYTGSCLNLHHQIIQFLNHLGEDVVNVCSVGCRHLMKS